MSEKDVPTASAEYQVGDIKYTVTPIYKNEAQKEALEDKVRRLIVSDKSRKE